MKELKYILQLKYFSSKLSVLWKKAQPQTNSYFKITSSTPLCSSLVFFLILPASWKISFCFSLWANRLFSYFPATPVRHKHLSPARVCFIFLGPRQGRVTPLQLGTCSGSCSSPSSSCAQCPDGVVGGHEGCWQLFACCRVLEHTALYFLRTVCTWLHGRVSKSFCNFPACIQRAQLRGSGRWWAVCGIFREVGR